MGRKRIRPIRDPRNLQGTRTITPRLQLMDQYGGKAALKEALEEARNNIAPQNTRALEFIDDELRKLFPEVDYDTYKQPIDVVPSAEMADTSQGMLLRNSDLIGDGSDAQAQLITGDFATVGEGDYRNRILTDPLMPDVEDMTNMYGLPAEGDTGARAARQLGVEGPMSEQILDDGQWYDYQGADGQGPSPRQTMRETDLSALASHTQDFDPELRQFPGASESVTPAGVDKTLMAIRRADGNPNLTLEQATQLIEEAADRGAKMFPSSLGRTRIDPQTGTLIEQLMALNYMPDNVRRFLPMRMRELFGVGGVAAGMNMDEQQGIDPRSTMGPLDGLLQ
jgi:hypothetical protein